MEPQEPQEPQKPQESQKPLPENNGTAEAASEKAAAVVGSERPETAYAAQGVNEFGPEEAAGTDVRDVAAAARAALILTETESSADQTLSMDWFKRKKAPITTRKSDQIEIPEGQWSKCAECAEIVHSRELSDNLHVCPNCGHHFRISAVDYFDLLFDGRRYELHDANLFAVDALEFEDRKSYKTRLIAAQKKSGVNDAVRSATGKVGGHGASIAAMDFSFIGGSMGSVVGEIISRAIKRAYENDLAMIIVSQSGGARMMEGALSLMQMAKTSAQLTRLAEAGLPYVSLLTNPTTGGVTASFAMLGDFHLAEPGALIGFAGPRVIRETMGQDLPEGFQRAEFLKEQGFIDQVVDRRKLKSTIGNILDLVYDVAPRREENGAAADGVTSVESRER